MPVKGIGELGLFCPGDVPLLVSVASAYFSILFDFPDYLDVSLLLSPLALSSSSSSLL